MHAEFLPARPQATIPARDPLAGPGQVDLCRYYTTVDSEARS